MYQLGILTNLNISYQLSDIFLIITYVVHLYAYMYFFLNLKLFRYAFFHSIKNFFNIF